MNGASSVRPELKGQTDTDSSLSPLLSVIFSLGPACGCLLTMSSYSNFDRNCHRDAIIIAVCNCGTSVFCGIVVFSALGFIAHDKGVEIEEVE